MIGRRRGAGDPAQVVEALRPADQCAARLEAQSRQMRISLGDIGRVGDDQIEAAGNIGEPVAFCEGNRCIEARGVSRSDFQRGRAGIYGQHLKLLRTRQGNRETAGRG